MIPIRDHQTSGIFPFITWTLLITNVLVFIYSFLLPGPELISFFNRFSVIPSQIVQGQALYTLFTAMFLHGSVGHILGNMLFLHIFGDNLEERYGHLKFLLFYLFCGVVASLLQISINSGSDVPNLGASGAIAGVMGGYLFLFPHHRIDLLVFLGFLIQRITVPAWTMLIYWFLAQLIYGFGDLNVTTTTGGIAYFAHIGGFAAGVLITGFFIRRRGQEG